MKKKITDLLQELSGREEGTFTYDEAGLSRDAALQDVAQGNIIIKILSAIGGVLATLALLGFLLLAGIYGSENGMFAVGLIFIAAAITGSRAVNHAFFDTVALTLYITGFILLWAGMARMEQSDNTTLSLFAIIAIAGILCSRGFMMMLISVLVFNGTLFCFFPVNDFYGDIQHLQLVYIMAILYLLTLKESRLLSGNVLLNKLFKPLQSGFFISFLAGLLWLAHRYSFGFWGRGGGHSWLLSIVIDIGILLLIAGILKSLSITHKGYIALIYLFTLAILIPVGYSPSLSGALFLLLLSVYYGYKAETGLSIAALVYFIIKYYYDLQLSLLVKSGLLFFPGILLLLVGYYYHKQLKKDEAI